MRKPNRFELLRGEHGSSFVELALLMPLFSLLVLSSVDFARALYLEIEIAGAARAGAIYGSQNPTDKTGMKTTAQDDAPDVPNVTVATPTYACECAIGPSSTYSANCTTSPTCTGNNKVYVVTVTVTGTYTPLFPWPGIPSSMSFSSSASMRSSGPTA